MPNFREGVDPLAKPGETHLEHTKYGTKHREGDRRCFRGFLNVMIRGIGMAYSAITTFLASIKYTVESRYINPH
jgi:hypothetical protein